MRQIRPKPKCRVCTGSNRDARLPTPLDGLPASVSSLRALHAEKRFRRSAEPWLVGFVTCDHVDAHIWVVPHGWGFRKGSIHAGRNGRSEGQEMEAHTIRKPSQSNMHDDGRAPRTLNPSARSLRGIFRATRRNKRFGHVCAQEHVSRPLLTWKSHRMTCAKPAGAELTSVNLRSNTFPLERIRTKKASAPPDLVASIGNNGTAVRTGTGIRGSSAQRVIGAATALAALYFWRDAAHREVDGRAGKPLRGAACCGPGGLLVTSDALVHLRHRVFQDARAPERAHPHDGRVRHLPDSKTRCADSNVQKQVRRNKPLLLAAVRAIPTVVVSGKDTHKLHSNQMLSAEKNRMR
eukprot:IDg23672t1